MAGISPNTSSDKSTLITESIPDMMCMIGIPYDVLDVLLENATDSPPPATPPVPIITAGASILATALGYGLSMYFESQRHAEDMAYKQAIHESYTKLSESVAVLSKKVEGK